MTNFSEESLMSFYIVVHGFLLLCLRWLSPVWYVGYSNARDHDRFGNLDCTVFAAWYRQNYVLVSIE